MLLFKQHSFNSINSVNTVDSVNSLAVYSAVLPPSTFFCLVSKSLRRSVKEVLIMESS